MADNSDAIRREYILNLFQYIRPVVNKFLFDLWETIYTDTNIPQRYWLEKFQLSLKSTLQIEPNTIKAALKQHTEDLASTLYKTYILTGYAYYDEAPQVKESVELLVNFVKDVVVSTAREVWYVPYYFYFTTHDKIKAPEGRHEIDKMIKNNIKLTLKQQVSEMIMAQRAVVEKYKDHIDDPANEGTQEEFEDDAESVALTDETTSEISSEVTKESEYEQSPEKTPPHSPLHSPPHSPLHSLPHSLPHSPPHSLPHSPPHSPPHSRSHSITHSPPRSPKYVLGSDLKLDLKDMSHTSSRASSTSSDVSLKALPMDGDDIHDIYIPRKSNPASLDIPLIKKKSAKERLYNNMNWYRGNPKLYQYLLERKRKKRAD